MQAASQARRIAEINVTPLIDIVMVLLIVFIVMVPMTGRMYTAVIPHVSGEMPKDTPPPVVLLDSKGQRTFEGRVLSPDNLIAAIQDKVKLQPINLRRVTLKVDGSLSMQRVIEAMDLLKVAGDQAEQENRQDPRLAKQKFKVLKVAMLLKK